MTVLVGVKCTDGVVIGADSVATASIGLMPLVRSAYPNKIVQIENRLILACTGPVGLQQRLTEHVTKAHNDDKLFQKRTQECVTEIAARACRDFSQSGTPRTRDQGFGFAAFLAAPFGTEAELVEFDLISFQPEIRRAPLHAGSLGSGQTLAEPFLAFVNKVLWRGQAPTVANALIGVYWVLSHTCELAPGGVGRPIQIGVLKRGEDKGRWQVNVLDEPDLQQMAQHVADIEQRIAQGPTEVIADATASKPPTPPNPKA